MDPFSQNGSKMVQFRLWGASFNLCASTACESSEESSACDMSISDVRMHVYSRCSCYTSAMQKMCNRLTYYAIQACISDELVGVSAKYKVRYTAYKYCAANTRTGQDIARLWRESSYLLRWLRHCSWHVLMQIQHWFPMINVLDPLWIAPILRYGTANRS